jgi:acetyl-CoA C-acetyltransferase
MLVAISRKDGASAPTLMNWEKAEELGLTPLVRIKGYGVAGVKPDYMGIGPVSASRKVLEANNLRVSDIDMFEIIEVFAAQYIACEKELKLDQNKN